jgi:glycosyltransferase involved in cell wall biosynthesis
LRLLIVTFDPPQNIGGVEGRVQGYLTQLMKRGDFVEVEAFAPGYRFTKEGFHGSRLHKCPSETRSIIRSFRYTLRVISGDSIDSVFLLSGGITIFGNMLLLYCRMRRKRTAILLYGKDILQARKGRLGKVLLFTSQLLTNQIVTNSRFTASLLPRYFQPGIAILYPSVDPGIQDTAGVHVPSKGGVILFVGRLVRRKGADDLIAAFNLLQSDIPAARLEIVGDGPERVNLEKLVTDLGLGKRVSFLGSLKGRALNEKYLECDVLVMPSRTLKDDVEGFGTVFLEAGLAGKPSIGTNSGGIPEAVIDGETGILVPEADIKELASALKRVLGDEALGKRLGENARRRVLTEFTWEETTRRLVQIMSKRAAT